MIVKHPDWLEYSPDLLSHEGIQTLMLGDRAWIGFILKVCVGVEVRAVCVCRAATWEKKAHWHRHAVTGTRLLQTTGTQRGTHSSERCQFVGTKAVKIGKTTQTDEL